MDFNFNDNLLENIMPMIMNKHKSKNIRKKYNHWLNISKTQNFLSKSISKMTSSIHCLLLSFLKRCVSLETRWLSLFYLSFSLNIDGICGWMYFQIRIVQNIILWRFQLRVFRNSRHVFYDYFFSFLECKLRTQLIFQSFRLYWRVLVISNLLQVINHRV